MSLIIELLKKKNAKEANISDENAAKKIQYESQTQQLLAETYLRSSTDPFPKKTASTEANKTLKAKKYTLPAILISAGFIIAGIVILILASHTLDVNITVIKKAPSPYENLLLKHEITLIGTATRERGHISLVSGAKDAPGVAIDLNSNLDMTDKSLLIGALPKKGTGNLKVILRDKNHRSYISDTLHISNTESGRQNFIITIDKAKESIDIKHINHIRVELEDSSHGDGGEPVILLEKVLLINTL